MNFDEFDGLKNFHTHTCYCDGSNTPEEMIFAALDAGMVALGFSGHSHMDFDQEVCMSVEGTDQYEEEVRTLGMEFGDQIEIFCGIEQDYYSNMPTDRWDYVIGSVHYVLPDVSVDDTPELFEKGIEEHFGGDVYSYCEKYYELVGDIVDRTGADIIGHFDLVNKFNAGGESGGKGKYFDESHPRYVAAWKKAADKLLKTDALFEINIGGMLRGYRTEPYPSKPILDYLKERGAGFIMSGDCHSVDNIMQAAAMFRDYEAQL